MIFQELYDKAISLSALLAELTPIQTLATYRNAMQDDEFALRFDTMTLEIVCMQIIRLIKVSHRHEGEHWLEEGSETDAIHML
jgi:hypothetical protein